MILYIKSEWYRLLRYKWTYLFIGICSFLLLSSNVLLAVVNQADDSFQYANTYFAFANVYSSLSMVYILCIAVSIIIFGNEYTGHTMKNSVSYGISRSTIYFGKLAVQIVYSILAFAIIIGTDVISAYLLLENSGFQEFQILIRACAGSLPLFICGLATVNCFAFNIEGSGAVAAAAGVMIALPLVSNALGMKFRLFAELAQRLPWSMLNFTSQDPVTGKLLLYWSSDTGFRNSWILGLLQAALLTLIGFLWFRKKEIR